MGIFSRQKKGDHIAAELQYDTSSGGLELVRPVYRVFDMLRGINTLKEKSWQAKARYYALNNIGLFGHSLDIIAYTAGQARLQYVNPTTYLEIQDPILQSKLGYPKWRADKTIYEALISAVWALACVGEFDLVYIDGEYDIFHVSQRLRSYQKKDGKKYILYKQREEDTKRDTIEIEENNIERCFVSQPGANYDAYSPARRILPDLELYEQITKQFTRIAYSNSLLPKFFYLGIDDNEWQQDEKYLSQFDDPNKAIPPVVNDAANLAKEATKDTFSAPFLPMMGPEAPQAIDATTSFDEQSRMMRKDIRATIADGLNIPARLLVSDDITHFSEAAQSEDLRNNATIPLLKVVLACFDKHIYSRYATSSGYSAKLWYSYDHIARSAALNPAQFIELFKIGAIGLSEVRRQLGIPEKAKIQSPEDIIYRRELLTGDSGLQQQQLAQKYGQEANAANPTAPLAHGQTRNVGDGTTTNQQKTEIDPSRPLTPNPVTGALKKKT